MHFNEGTTIKDSLLIGHDLFKSTTLTTFSASLLNAVSTKSTTLKRSSLNSFISKSLVEKKKNKNTIRKGAR